VGKENQPDAVKSEGTENGNVVVADDQETKPVVPVEDKPSIGGGMFKKRKAPASSSRSVRRKE
jgi:hypothetical protein